MCMNGSSALIKPRDIRRSTAFAGNSNACGPVMAVNIVHGAVFALFEFLLADLDVSRNVFHGFAFVVRVINHGNYMATFVG